MYDVPCPDRRDVIGDGGRAIYPGQRGDETL